MSSPYIPGQEAEADPFRYGWRFVRQTLPDGNEQQIQVPLTLADVLHPQEADVIPENTLHERLRRYFHNVCERLLAEDPCRLSVSDCLLDWGRPDIGNHSPDLAILQRELPWPWSNWGTLRLLEEQARALLVLEIVSPHTRSNDVVEKLREYWELDIPLYLIVDQEKEGGPLRLLGYRRTPKGWDRLTTNERGRLPVELLGVELAVQQERVVLYAARTGEELGDYTAVCTQLEKEVRAREEAEKSAQEHAAARQAAEEREHQQAEARRQAEEAQRGAEEARRTAEEARRTAEEARRTAEERVRHQEEARRLAEQQATALAAQLQALQEQLQRLQQAPPH